MNGCNMQLNRALEWNHLFLSDVIQEETEAQRGLRTCLRSHSRALGFVQRKPGTIHQFLDKNTASFQ